MSPTRTTHDRSEDIIRLCGVGVNSRAPVVDVPVRLDADEDEPAETKAPNVPLEMLAPDGLTRFKGNGCRDVAEMRPGLDRFALARWPNTSVDIPTKMPTLALPQTSTFRVRKERPCLRRPCFMLDVSPTVCGSLVQKKTKASVSSAQAKTRDRSGRSSPRHWMRKLCAP